MINRLHLSCKHIAVKKGLESGDLSKCLRDLAKCPAGNLANCPGDLAKCLVDLANVQEI